MVSHYSGISLSAVVQILKPDHSIMFVLQQTALPQNKFTILTTLSKFCREETSELGTLLAWLGKTHP